MGAQEVLRSVRRFVVWQVRGPTLGVRTGGATLIRKGGKGLGRRVAKGGTTGVSWHGGCAPPHANQSEPLGLPQAV
jgi:hypothetical protein